MSKREPRILRSALSRKFTSDGMTIDVEIYQLEGAAGWVLELAEPDGSSTVWEELFPTDQAAWEEFEQGVREIGLIALLDAGEAVDAPPTLH
ncbi:hypothetical protein [Mycoplana sp. MJR14]|uniref:hypothetical protein n=1 Tax=Mycoplana sp. MJR14 TaxID=3032583 RepID=UPI0023DB14C3|nr:hypothetical protein [Mycoplana sp. MJR14]MDF1631892.1 hypothetical protein [Mycoplana sp. MJR14]